MSLSGILERSEPGAVGAAPARGQHPVGGAVMADRTCAVPSCSDPVSKRGWCNRHYLRWRRTGDPEGSLRLDVTSRFWGYVDKAGPLPSERPDLGPCWLWTASLDSHGYGQFRIARRTVRTHRWAWISLRGEHAPGLELDHLCRVRECCNPDHLEPVTRQVNNARGASVSAKAKRKTHCVRGHEFTPENTYIGPRGHRACIACRRAADRRRDPARKRRSP